MSTGYDSTLQSGADPAGADGHDYREGADIFGADGERIGSLSGKGVQNGYLVVHHGMLLGKDAYIPLSRVIDTKADGIYTDVGKDGLGEFDASEAPAGAPQNVGGAGGGDMWTFAGDEDPAGAEQPINQPAPLHMRAPRPSGASLGTNAPLGAGAQNLTSNNIGEETENQEVSDTVRRERLGVDSDGVDLGGTGQQMASNLDEDQGDMTTQL